MARRSRSRSRPGRTCRWWSTSRRSRRGERSAMRARSHTRSTSRCSSPIGSLALASRLPEEHMAKKLEVRLAKGSGAPEAAIYIDGKLSGRFVALSLFNPAIQEAFGTPSPGAVVACEWIDDPTPENVRPRDYAHGVAQPVLGPRPDRL